MDWFRLGAFVWMAISLLHEISACGRNRRRCPPRDTTPPSLTCPSSIITIADPIQNHAKVTWVEPRAYDNGKEVSVTRQGLGPGKLFNEGRTTIRYSARDRAGNSRSCTFTITVTVVRCSRFRTPSDGYRICYLSTEMRYGSTCRFGCYPGHKLVGASITRCKNDGRWSIPTQPSCEKRTCPQLYQPSAAVTITCTDSNNYRSKCTYSCIEGYSIRQGYSKVRVCGAYGSWVGAEPICVDTRPPEYTNCSKVISRYAERSRTSGRVFWDDPIVTDNSGKVTLSQIDGPESGSELGVGEYYIQYRAIDEAENRANCQFNLVVKLITCPAIYPLPRTSVTCPTGRLWGSTCQFACDNNTASSLPLETVCDRHGSKYYYGLWDFGNQQPYCEQENTCPELSAPDYGAMACDTWASGRYCQMLCQNGYTVYESPGDNVHQGLLVCGNSGVWRISDVIPDCVEEDPRIEANIKVRYSYGFYEGPCQDAIEEIKATFLLSYGNALGSCTPPKCSVANVKVICGSTLKKRDTSVRRRDTSSPLYIEVDHTINGDTTFAEKTEQREGLKSRLTEAQMDGSLDLTVGNQSLAVTGVEIDQAQASCDPGWVPNNALSCVKCGIGYYDDRTVTPNICTKCDIGYYQDLTGQSTCKQCPVGETTETTGARECKEACPIGHYSAKGTPPCSPCDIGTYATVTGTRECTYCSGAMTTNITGATSPSQCFEFDMELAGPDDGEFEPASVIVDTSSAQQLGISLWLKCSSCDDDVINITNQNGDNFITIKGSNGIQLYVGSNTLPTVDIDIASSNRWRYLYVSWTPDVVNMYIDGELEQTTAQSTASLSPELNVTVGGPGYIGRISQVNVHSTLSTQRRRRSTQDPGDTCFSGSHGDVLSWREFALLDGSFVQTRSKCDAFDNCLSSPCLNNGICTDAIDNFICECTEGFTGSDCSENIDDCEHSVCDNNGTCVDGVDGYTCKCTTGFSGELCEIKVVDGAWGDFGNWSLCSVTCGTGEQTRQRTCDSPEPSNGGEECVGSELDTRPCVLEACIDECIRDPLPIANGNLNCDTVNETRSCKPECDEDHAFDTDILVDPPNIVCGPETGNKWNFRNEEYTSWLIPASCQEKKMGKTNIGNVKMDYRELGGLTPQMPDEIKNNVITEVSNLGCVATKRCDIENINVGITSETGSRRRRSTSFVQVTIDISCDIHTSIDECYNLIAAVVYALNDLIGAYAFTVTYDGSPYDVTINSTFVDGTTVCGSGHVPVLHFCVACGTGMYQNGEFCEVCSVGYYQDETGQAQCKQCPEGWTTLGEQSRSSSDCNVEATISDDESTSYALLIGLVVGTVALVFIVLAVAIVLYKYVKSNKKKCTVGSVTDIQNRDTNSNRRFTAPPVFNTLYSGTLSPLPSKHAGIGLIDLEDDVTLPEIDERTATPTTKSYFNRGYTNENNLDKI